METEVRFAGFGGQGILLSGKILAHAIMEMGMEVAWIPSYGPEMRGGTAYCTVVASDNTIGSPIINNPRHLVAMNQPSFEKFEPMVKSNGIVIINSSLIQSGSRRMDIDQLLIPVNEIAAKIGNVKTANMVALAALVARSQIVTFDVLEKCLMDEFSKKESLIPANFKALEEGKKFTITH